MKLTVEVKVSDEEKKIITLLSDGRSIQEVCDKTGLSKGFVDSKVLNLRRLLGAANTPHLVAIALRQKLIQ